MFVFKRESTAKRLLQHLLESYLDSLIVLWKCFLLSVIEGKINWWFTLKVEKMPNIMNRRKKKNKVLEIVSNDKCDSSDSSSSYDFSSSLNRNYSLSADDFELNKSVTLSKDENGDCTLIRLLIESFRLPPNYIIWRFITLRKECMMKMLR